MGGILTTDETPPEPTESQEIIDDRGEFIMTTLCSAIQVDPQSEHTNRLVREYSECIENMSEDLAYRLRKVLLMTLNDEIKLHMSKENWDEDRLQYLKNWVQKLTIEKN